MFRNEPMAFLALPVDKQHSGLRQVIESTLRRFGVRSSVTAEGSPQGRATEESVREMVRDSDIVIADLTGANSNVLFEVGMALGMGKKVVLLSEERTSALPFDVKSEQVAVYRPDDFGSIEKYLSLVVGDTLKS